MNKTIGGFMLVKDAVKYDYCMKEAIESLLGFCDQVVVVKVLSEDNTGAILTELCIEYPNLSVFHFHDHEWNEIHGKEKLSIFQNKAISQLKTDYQFLCQADEIVHEKSYPEIRKAVETDGDAFMCNRINLWGSPYMQLDVPLNRMPCSKSVVRLTKTGYKTYDDGENIEAPLVNTYFEIGIRIYHMGFVRKQEVMKSKIINMQENIFNTSHDVKLDQCEIFNPDLWFDPKTDLKPIDEPLPKLIQQWARDRVYD